MAKQKLYTEIVICDQFGLSKRNQFYVKKVHKGKKMTMQQWYSVFKAANILTEKPAVMIALEKKK